MLKKMTVCAVLAVLLIGGVSFAADPAGGGQGKRKARQGQVQKNRAQRTDLVGQLIRAYNAGDRQKIGNIIGQMEQRRTRARSAEKPRSATKPRQSSRKAVAGQRAGAGQKPLGGIKMQKGQRPNRDSGRLQRGFAEPGPARQAAGLVAGARKRRVAERRADWRRGATGMRSWPGMRQRPGAMGMRSWPGMRQRPGAMGIRSWRGTRQRPGAMGMRGRRGMRRRRGAMGMRGRRGMRQRRGAMGMRRWQGMGPGQRRMW